MADEIKTTSITISGTFDSAEVKTFAIDHGWEETLVQYKEDEVEGRIKIEEPNKETFESFVADHFYGIVLTALNESSIKKIENKITIQRQSETEAAEQKLKDSFTVEIK